MKTAVIAALIALLPAAPAFAQSKAAKKPVPPKTQTDTHVKDCAEYGAGFKRVDGTGTCVKIGGYVRIEGGGSR
jgi:hypothetical protein